MQSEVARNVAGIRQRIDAAARRSGREVSTITLVAVSKTFPPELVDEALAAGITDIGENRVQELAVKVEAVKGRPRWHMIGHLQSNKAKEAARLADVVQSVDSLALAEKLGRAAKSIEKTLDVLIEVNIGEESQKAGVSPSEAESLCTSVASIEALRLRGVMAIPPVEREVRPYFVKMRELFERLRTRFDGFDSLSMGMSDDFEIAVEEGSTMVRVGRAIFGSRTK